MILKIIAVIIIAFLVYTLFFKRNREKEMFKKNEKITDEMMECPTCKTYVSQKEALLSNGKFYCSKECLENK